jgi:mRNA-degrading endonuclease RelE of RelBE toxin-antitoxin system
LSGPFRLDIPSHVAERIRTLPPEVKQGVKHALRLLSNDPATGEPLRGDLEGYWKYRVRRYRVIYRPVRRVVQVLAIGHRRTIYEEVGNRLRSKN